MAIAAAVLTGALLVGGAVRASLRDLILERLGRTTYVATGAHYFREQLSAETSGCPLIVTQGVVTNAQSRRRAGAVNVYGVDERFWRFHGMAVSAAAAISPGLAAEVGLGELLLRIEKPSTIPKESLHGRKDEGRTIRLAGAAVIPREQLGEFSLRPEQGAVRAVFVPLRRLQRELGEAGHVNTILFDGPSPPRLKGKAALDDLGVQVRELPEAGVSVESDAAIVSDALAEAVGPGGHPVFSYLANTIRAGSVEIPYSLVTAVDNSLLPIAADGIYLNSWAASKLHAKPGDAVTLDYYVWGDGGSLLTRTAQFRLQAVLPLRGLAADRNLTPEYPGITQAKTLRDWDPPFPMDLRRIRPRDEAYWDRYRTTPKAFIGIASGQKLWGSRFGRMTSLRVTGTTAAAVRQRLADRLDPAQLGLAVYSPRASGLEAARGSTDFGEYFTYFSFFLVVSALLLASLFFRLGLEQRFTEIGTLRALGWALPEIRRAFLAEGLALSVLGSLLGIAGAIGYCAFVLYGLRTWWRDAVGTTALTLHVDAASLALGAFSTALIAILIIWWTLRTVGRISPRSLISGSGLTAANGGSRTWAQSVALLLIVCAAGMMAAARTIGVTEAFFGAGTLLLIAALLLQSRWLRSPRHRRFGLDHSPSLWALGFRNASHRPGRSLLCIALVASAIFLLVALEAFRQSGGDAAGAGGFPLMAESQLPIFWDPNTAAGRESLNLPDSLQAIHFFAFRLHPGEDASCLNLYEPRDPRVLGARGDFLALARFHFAGSLAKSEAQKKNPWLLLGGDGQGAVPAIADANSITYVLHKKLGDELTVNGRRLRIVGALQDSALQSELIVSERNFMELFPDNQGYRFFLLDAPSPAAGAILEEALSDYGFDATPTAARLAGYHRVENTYLSTFQALGALGLLLGTIGLAAVLLRNVLERRREMALLAALGFRRDQLSRIVLAENAFLVASGLVTGAVCAWLAVVPAGWERGGVTITARLLMLLIAVPATAAISSLLAVRVVRRRPTLLQSLRTE